MRSKLRAIPYVIVEAIGGARSNNQRLTALGG